MTATYEIHMYEDNVENSRLKGYEKCEFMRDIANYKRFLDMNTVPSAQRGTLQRLSAHVRACPASLNWCFRILKNV